MSTSTLDCPRVETARGLHFADDHSHADVKPCRRSLTTAAIPYNAEQKELNIMDVVQEISRDRNLADEELALLAHEIVQDLQDARRDLRHVSLDEVKRRIARAGRRVRGSAD